MEAVLQECNLQHLYTNFEREKITPDIICKLGKDDMVALGVLNPADMMRLRTSCISFGSQKPSKVAQPQNAGPPKFIIPKTVLKNYLEDDFLIADIAKLLSVSERTIYRRMQEYNLKKEDFADIEDSEFDMKVYETIKDFPFCGETMLRQLLSQRNIKVQRSRLRDSLHRLDERGLQGRKARRLKRRVYNVEGPNHLWHMDSNHKLVRWNFIIVGGVDGFSRLITFLKCTNNNKAETILSCFLDGVQEFGVPDRVRADQGMENCKVADFMIETRGLNRGSMLLGKSVHNQRIERLWRDVFDGVLCFYYNLFYFMEEEGILDSFQESNLLALHHVFLHKINEKLKLWREAWAHHRIRTVKSSPIRLWTAGQLNNPIGIDIADIDLAYYGIEGNIEDIHNSEEENARPIFDGLSVLNDGCMQQLLIQCPASWTSANFGIDIYLKALNIINSFTHQ